ncbi:MAG TPA: FmdB family zinc ribbon protein [Vicinamibacterales bacterium]|nr:FmdB family zinc ribbon protein [Vicinamibacterales bacterium]
MPLYEYQCESCAHRFERIQKFSDPPVETCPQCGGAVRKLLSSPAIQFKGSGFYITDYGKGGSGGESKSEKADKAGAASEAKTDKADTKTDAKPAAKADTGGSKAD